MTRSLTDKAHFGELARDPGALAGTRALRQMAGENGAPTHGKGGRKLTRLWRVCEALGPVPRGNRPKAGALRQSVGGST